jgi:hypothetical protein
MIAFYYIIAQLIEYFHSDVVTFDFDNRYGCITGYNKHCRKERGLTKTILDF